MTVHRTPDKSGYQEKKILFLHENICCGYSLEGPCQGPSNEYHNICFCGQLWKISTYFGKKKCLIWSYDTVKKIWSWKYLTFSTLAKTFSRRHMETFFSYFSQMETICIKCQSLFSGKIKTWNYNTLLLSCWGQITIKNWWNLPISNSKADLHNINAHTKFGENPLKFTCFHPETKIQTAGWTYDKGMDGWKDRHIDDQCDTIIPCQYCVVGIRKLSPICHLLN